LEHHRLSDLLSEACGGQLTAPFGMALLQLKDTVIGAEICEELWAPQAPHVAMAMQGCEIFLNGSGSHHSLRKLDARLTLLQDATAKCGGVYLYANHRGCDGTRLYFDGSALVTVNGTLRAQASQFSLKEVEVITCVVDLKEVRVHRQASASLQEQSSLAKATFPVIDVDFVLCSRRCAPNVAIVPRIHRPEEECLLGPACWLWDYLRRSGAGGFLLPLSGGADSSSVCAIVYTMCLMAVKEAGLGNGPVRDKVLSICPDLDDSIASDHDDCKRRRVEAGGDHEKAKALCNRVLCTTYLGTKNSSRLTHDRAAKLAGATGAYFSPLYIDAIVDAVLTVFSSVQSARTPRFLVHGGTNTEDLALQNIQARLRMVMAYLLAQLLPWVRGSSGFLLVLASANVDESLRGYMTKYDCSSADLNPIGGMCKADLKRMMEYASKTYVDMGILEEIALAPPTAELQPLGDGTSASADYTQLDEVDMGMSYAELTVFGRLRKISRCGPVSMFRTLLTTGALQATRVTAYTIQEIAAKVKLFFKFYAINRHKMTTITPSYHAEAYGCDDNRFDFRPFLYNVFWPRQNRIIDQIVEEELKKED
jgi:NAD+ synthase (glutamine-hydrolysing)